MASDAGARGRNQDESYRDQDAALRRGLRNYSFVKLTTDDGIVGWSECDEGFGSPGVTAAIEQLAERVVGQDVFAHERVYAELYCVTRPAAGGVVAEAMGAIENALIDAKAPPPRCPTCASWRSTLIVSPGTTSW